MIKIIFLINILLAIVAREGFAQHDHASANPASKIKQSIILQQLLNEQGLENKEIRMAVAEFPPGSIGRPHRHPCPTFGYLLEGELESVFEGKTYQYKAGDSFYEKANGLHNATRNRDSVVTARLLVFFITAPEAATSVPEK